MTTATTTVTKSKAPAEPRKSLSFNKTQLDLIVGQLAGYDNSLYTEEQCDAIDKLVARFDNALSKLT